MPLQRLTRELLLQTTEKIAKLPFRPSQEWVRAVQTGLLKLQPAFLAQEAKNWRNIPLREKFLRGILPGLRNIFDIPSNNRMNLFLL